MAENGEQVKWGKVIARFCQEGLKPKNIVKWPYPQEKPRAEDGEGPAFTARGSSSEVSSQMHRARSPSVGHKLMRGVDFIYCHVPSLLRLPHAYLNVPAVPA